MNCRDFEEKLHQLADPASPGFLRLAAEAHAAGCSRCRRLLAIAAGEEEPFDPGTAEELTASILRGTSGPVCDRIDGFLCDWVDDGLPDGDVDLLLQHLDRCPACRSTAAVLRELRETLPLLAEIAPDARFVRDVLDRTVHAGKREPAPLAAPDRWVTGLFRRPRFAQEIAYVAAMVLVLLFGARPDLLDRRDLADSATISRPPSMSASSALGQGAEAVAELAGDVGGFLEDLAFRHPALDLQSRAPGIARTVARIDGSAEWLARDAGRAAAALFRLDPVEIWNAFVECRDGLRECWKDSATTEPSAIPLRSPGQARRPQDQRRLEEDVNHDHDARSDGAE
jgi:hypothetical protein